MNNSKRSIEFCSVIKLYEIGEMDQRTFFERITGCGQRTIIVDGLERFLFYLNKSTHLSFDDETDILDKIYYIAPYPKNSSQL